MRVTLSAAIHDHVRGVRTFYITSLTEPAGGKQYAMKVIRRGRRRLMTCDCPDFFHRCQPLGLSCKHLRVLRGVIRQMGGVSRIPQGARVTARMEVDR